MSRSNTRSFIARLLLFVSALALVGAELVVTAQNSNSSTTMQDDNMAASNMSGTKRSKRGRRGRRRRTSMSNAPAACGPAQENMNMDGAMQTNANTAGNMSMTPPKTGGCDPNTQTPEDLSGTYTGKVGYSDAGLSGDATLTINGNDFTLTTTTGPTTQEGRIVAVNTCNYIGVTMMFGKWQATAPGGTPAPAVPIISLRAKRTGGGLVLTEAPGEMRQFSFTSTGSGKPSGKKRRGRPIKVGIKPPTE